MHDRMQLMGLQAKQFVRAQPLERGQLAVAQVAISQQRQRRDAGCRLGLLRG